VSRVDILRAIAPGDTYSTVGFVRPGGESLLRLNGWPRSNGVLQAIDAIEALEIDPARHRAGVLAARPQPLTASAVPHAYTP